MASNLRTVMSSTMNTVMQTAVSVSARGPDRHMVNSHVFAHLPAPRCQEPRCARLMGYWRHRTLCAVLLCAWLTGLVVDTRTAWGATVSVLLLVWAWDAYVRRCQEWKRYAGEYQHLRMLLAVETVETFYEAARDEQTFSHQEKDIVSFGNRPASQTDPVHYLRYLWLQRLLKTFFPSRGRAILDLGCQHGLMTTLFDRPGRMLVATDLNPEAVRLVHAAHRQWRIARTDAGALPFTSAQFDAINFSEVIEHLSNPRIALKEIMRCLRPGGIFFLTTNNRHGLLWSDWLNPFCVGEKILGLVFPSLLPPPALLWKHEGYGLSFYHTNFTSSEIVALIREAGMEVLQLRSYGHFGELYQVILQICPSWTEQQMAQVLHWVDRVCNRLPVLNRLGMAWLIVGRKPGGWRQVD